MFRHIGSTNSHVLASNCFSRTCLITMRAAVRRCAESAGWCPPTRRGGQACQRGMDPCRYVLICLLVAAFLRFFTGTLVYALLINELKSYACGITAEEIAGLQSLRGPRKGLLERTRQRYAKTRYDAISINITRSFWL